MVARPSGVTPKISLESLLQVKCSLHLAVRGLKSLALWEWLCKRAIIQYVCTYFQQLSQTFRLLAQPFPKSPYFRAPYHNGGLFRVGETGHFVLQLYIMACSK